MINCFRGEHFLNTTPIRNVKPYLFGIEDMRVLSVRRAQNYPNLTMFDYLDTKIGLIMPYMKVSNELNKRDFAKRFVYSYTGFTELGTHSETDFQVYCTRSFSQEHGKNPSYFSLNQVIQGFPSDSRREFKYYRGWGLKGGFSDIENVINVQGTGYMNHFVN